MLPSVWKEELGDGAEYRIEVEDENGLRTVLAHRTVDAKTRPDDRRWFWYRLDLSRWAGRQVTLVLSVAPGPEGDADHDLGGWGQPQVLVGGAGPG